MVHPLRKESGHGLRRETPDQIAAKMRGKI